MSQTHSSVFKSTPIKILAALDPYDVSMCILFESPDLKVFQSYAPFFPDIIIPVFPCTVIGIYSLYTDIA